MKQILALLLVLCLLLAGCMEPSGTTLPTTEPTQLTQPTTQPEHPGVPTEPDVPTASTQGSTEPDAPTAPTQDSTEPATQPTEPTTQPTAPTEPATQPTEPPYTEAPEACMLHQTDPYIGVDKETFYANYTTACCYADASYRTLHYLMSGSLEVPGQYAEEAAYRPMDGDKYIHNTHTWYENDGKTYVVVDAFGREMMRIYKGAAYITLEEVAAYIYAFGGSNANLPANYTSKKVTKVGTNPWGIYLRGNHSNFSGDTSRYPYEPELPDISGCGGRLRYFELDIGTTGTETPGYRPALYNNGASITRGAARLVYARQDLNGNGVYEQGEIYVFYTHNHYNDFREYLNYYGGWGEMFGNVTGGGVYSSNTNCNPTPYPVTVYDDFLQPRNPI